MAAEKSRGPDVTTVEIISDVEKRSLTLTNYDSQWPETYAGHAQRIRAALGPAAVQIDHIGSTPVPGLSAKPIVGHGGEHH